MNLVLQLNNSQLVNSFNSLVVKFNMKRPPHQPNQNPNQSVIDRVKFDNTEDVFVVKGETSRKSMRKVLHEEFSSSDRSGKLERLSEDMRVKHAHDESGQLDERNNLSSHSERQS